MFKYKNIYIAACDSQGGIYHYKVQDEKIVFCEKTLLDHPMFLCIENNKLYAIQREPFQNNLSGVVCFDLDADGKPVNKSEIICTGGAAGCHLSVNNGSVFVANYLSGSITKLGEKLVTHTGMGVNLPRQNTAHCHFTGLTPDKKYILVCDLGLDTVFTYDLDLNLVSKAYVPAGYGCRHIAFSNDGTLAYCVNELKSSVSVFEYSNGVLNYLDTYSALPDDFTTLNTAAAVRVDKGYLYVSNRGHNSVAVFKINDKKLEKPEYFSCGGEGPRDININGEYLFSTNEQTNNVTLHKIENGKLQFIKVVDTVPDPLCVIFN